jgi:hypothetical protein
MNHNFFKKIDRLFFPIFLSLSFLFSFLSSSLIFSFLFLPLSSLHPVASLCLPSFSTVRPSPISSSSVCSGEAARHGTGARRRWCSGEVTCRRGSGHVGGAAPASARDAGEATA